MLSLELQDILDDDMDKAEEVNVSTIVGDFKIMDKAGVADVSAIVGVEDVTSKLKFKTNFSGRKGCYRSDVDTLRYHSRLTLYLDPCQVKSPFYAF